MQLNISGTERETESLYPDANCQHLVPRWAFSGRRHRAKTQNAHGKQ